MSTALDIKAVLGRIGIEASTIRSGEVTVSGEYIRGIPNKQVTKPFIREFFIEATLPYDCGMVPGDIVELNATGNRYLIMNKTPQILSNAVVQYDAVLYKCNVSGELKRPSGEVRNVTTDYHKTQQWSQVRETCYALLTEPMFGHDLESNEELGLIGLTRHELYVPGNVGIRALDRFEPVSGEFYRVETIKTRRYSNVDVVELSEDTR